MGGLELIKVSEADKTQRIKGVTFEIRKMDGALVIPLKGALVTVSVVVSLSRMVK